MLRPPRHFGRVPPERVANRVLNRLLRTKKDARSMRLERWVHRASGDRIVQVCLDALAERGVVRRHTRSFLGLFHPQGRPGRPAPRRW